MKVLVADDDPTSRLLLQTVLRSWDYEVTAVEDGPEALELLLGDDPAPLAILDWMMPGMDGVDVCRELRLRQGDKRTYVVLLTARGGTDDLAEGLNAGADDYLGKPFAPAELRARLAVGKRFAELYRSLLSAQRELEWLARTDPLTGIMNRRAIMERLEAEVARAAREAGIVSVAMMDVDLFKRVNDTYGHAVGDEVLRELAARAHEVIRPYDAIGRFGGEEFLIVMPGVSEADAAGICERIRVAIVGHPVVSASGPASVRVTVSVGVAAGRGDSSGRLIILADDALYAAKRAGRNRVVGSSLVVPVMQ